jgi:hypothetical protein
VAPEVRAVTNRTYGRKNLPLLRTFALVNQENQSLYNNKSINSNHS